MRILKVKISEHFTIAQEEGGSIFLFRGKISAVLLFSSYCILREDCTVICNLQQDSFKQKSMAVEGGGCSIGHTGVDQVARMYTYPSQNCR